MKKRVKQAKNGYIDYDNRKKFAKNTQKTLQKSYFLRRFYEKNSFFRRERIR